MREPTDLAVPSPESRRPDHYPLDTQHYYLTQSPEATLTGGITSSKGGVGSGCN